MTFQVVLIGNYKKDKQESMSKFLAMIEKGLMEKAIRVTVWNPVCLFGYFTTNSLKGIGKWLSYLDKYVLTIFIWWLKLLLKNSRDKNTIYHICDHSNAIYQSLFPSNQLLVTCHDVLAIRGALGFQDAYCKASKTGVILQKNILSQLNQIKHLAFVSHQTHKQYKEISNASHEIETVIHNGLNDPFTLLTENEIEIKKQAFPNFPKSPYLLHVGSNLPRKNRKLLIDIISYLGEDFSGQLCFAGKVPDAALNQLIHTSNLTNRIVCIENPSHEELNLLYNCCACFIFPSLSEGFGWPIIEAQASGAPVICSAMEPFFEITTNSVLYADNQSPEEFTNQIIKLKNTDFKKNLILKGLENQNRFKPEIMLENYIKTYQQILS